MLSIRFRVWDNINKKWTTDYVILQSNHSIRPVLCIHCFDKNGIMVESEPSLCVERKDRLGNVIFEGDILQNPHNKQQKFSVVFGNGMFSLETISPKQHKLKNINNLDDLELIGNKYENPELLETINKGAA